MRIHTKKIIPTDLDSFKRLEAEKSLEYEWKVEESPFLFLTTELPPPPLFKDEFHENIIPQVHTGLSLIRFFSKCLILIGCRFLFTTYCPSLMESRRKNTRRTKTTSSRDLNSLNYQGKKRLPSQLGIFLGVPKVKIYS